MFDFNPWELLGVDEGTSIEEVGRLRRTLVVKVILNARREGRNADDEVKKLNKAIDVLTNEEARKHFMISTENDNDGSIDFQTYPNFELAWERACDILPRQVVQKNKKVSENEAENPKVVKKNVETDQDQFKNKNTQPPTKSHVANENRKKEQTTTSSNEEPERNNIAKHEQEVKRRQSNEKSKTGKDQKFTGEKTKKPQDQQRQSNNEENSSSPEFVETSTNFPCLVLNDLFLRENDKRKSEQEDSNVKKRKKTELPIQVSAQENQNREPRDIIIEELKAQLQNEKKKNAELCAKLKQVTEAFKNANQKGVVPVNEPKNFRMRKTGLINKIEALNFGIQTTKEIVFSDYGTKHSPIGNVECKCGLTLKSNSALQRHCWPLWIKCLIKNCNHCARVDNFLLHLQQKHPKSKYIYDLIYPESH